MIDLDRFVSSVVSVRNDQGGRGYDSGIRVFNCPLCNDTKGRGWVGTEGWGAGCFNLDCVAEPRLQGGAIEWAQRVLRLDTRAAAWRYLEKEYGGAYVPPKPRAPRGADFCVFPEGSQYFVTDGPSVIQGVFETFIKRQWSIGVLDAARWNLGWCLRGPHAFRVVIPVQMGGIVVGFQARTIKDGVEPKYLTSSNVPSRGRPAECGRPAAAMLFNADAIQRGRDAILVEGPGDVMAWSVNHVVPAVGLMGVALTAEKIATIRAAAPSLVIVALDAEPDAQRRALAHVEDLRAHDVNAKLGAWVGAKDAGAGADLQTAVRAPSLADRVRGALHR